MVLYYINLEIDGFFLAEEDILLTEFQAKELYFGKNNIVKKIKKGSHIIYEVKSGENVKSLIKQIIRDYYFFEKFFEVYPGYNIKNFIFLGFLRTKRNFTNLIEKFKNEFNELDNLQIPFVLLRYEDLLFGESVFYENLELNELGKLKALVEENSKKIKNLDEKFNQLDRKVDEKFNQLDRKVDEKFDKLDRKVDEKFGNLDQKFETKYEEISKNIKTIMEKLDGKTSLGNGQQNGFSEFPQQHPYPNTFHPIMMPSSGFYYFPPFPTYPANQNGDASRNGELSKKFEDK